MLNWLQPSLYENDTIAIYDDNRSVTYRQLWQEITIMSNLLQTMPHKRVGLYMANCIEWVVIDLACSLNNITITPLPAFFSDQQLQHIINEANISLIITDQPNNTNNFFNGKSVNCNLPNIHIFQTTTQAEHNSNIHKITFTSGSTGTPKGVCLNNKNIEIVVTSFQQQLNKLIGNHFCLLPLSTLLENIAGVYTSLLAHGTIYLTKKISIYHLNQQTLQTLFNYIEDKKIHTIILVPQLLKIFVSWYNNTQQNHSLKFIALGGAKASPTLINQAIQLGLPVFEGYGLSESSSVVTLNTPKNNKPGSVGKPLPHIDIKLSNDGEILVKGANCLGYYNCNPPSLDNEDYWHTGDLGTLDAEGFLHLTGRKKNLIITPLGRNISPEWIESELNTHSDILQSAVFLDINDELSAIITTEKTIDLKKLLSMTNEQLPEYAHLKNIKIAEKPFSTANKTLSPGGQPLRKNIKVQYQNKGVQYVTI